MSEETTNSTQSEDKSFLERAQEVISSAVDSTVEAVKERPATAAAIAAGATAAVAGAAYGISKLREGEDSKD